MNSVHGNISRVSSVIRISVQLIPLVLLLNCALALYADENSIYPDIAYYLLQCLSFPTLLICWYHQKNGKWEGSHSVIIAFNKVFRFINALLFVLHIVFFFVGIHTILYAGPLTFSLCLNGH